MPELLCSNRRTKSVTSASYATVIRELVTFVEPRLDVLVCPGPLTQLSHLRVLQKTDGPVSGCGEAGTAGKAIPQAVQVLSLLGRDLVPALVAIGEQPPGEQRRRVERLMQVADQVNEPAEVQGAILGLCLRIEHDRPGMGDRLHDVHRFLSVWIARHVQAQVNAVFDLVLECLLVGRREKVGQVNEVPRAVMVLLSQTRPFQAPGQVGPDRRLLNDPLVGVRGRQVSWASSWRSLPRTAGAASRGR